jgi:4-amino-4-deoxy-L-arabinose transferase-like glycosyltransferase
MISQWPVLSREGRQRVLRRALIWGTCLVALCLLVRGHALRDADSILYDTIARSLEPRPFTQWIVPLWPPGWPSGEGLFVDHLACFFWPAALLGKLGLRGALAANFLWVLLSFALLFRLSRALAGVEVAWLTVLFYAVSPAGLLYLVRANHEPALACAYLGALWCIASEKPRPLALAGFVLLAVAIKGALGLIVFPTVLVAWWTSHRRRRDLAGLLLGAALVGAFCGLYESWFEHAAGGTFFDSYVSKQFVGVVEQERLGFLNKLATPAYYAGSAAWFGLPGAGLVLLALARRRRADEGPQRAVLLPAGTCIAILSLMARRAVRYAFPAFALCNLAGAQLVVGRMPQGGEWIGKHTRALELALALWLVAVTAARVAM